jgi:hypothetical protein
MEYIPGSFFYRCGGLKYENKVWGRQAMERSQKQPLIKVTKFTFTLKSNIGRKCCIIYY